MREEWLPLLSSLLLPPFGSHLESPPEEGNTGELERKCVMLIVYALISLSYAHIYLSYKTSRIHTIMCSVKLHV